MGVLQGSALFLTIFSLFIYRLANHIPNTGGHVIQLLLGLIELFILPFAADVAYWLPLLVVYKINYSL